MVANPDKMKKRILLLHTGGTIGMVRDRESGVLKPDLFYRSLLEFIPELSSMAELKVSIPFAMDSSQITCRHWIELARIIHDSADKTDGVVVTHGTDTLAYTSSALSFMLESPPFPIILTGAQKPLGELRSDARNNLVNAIDLATTAIREVGLFFDYRLFRGNRATKSHNFNFDAFSSPNYPLLAEVGLESEIHQDHLLRYGKDFRLWDKLDNRLAVLRLCPGLDITAFEPPADCRAAVLIGFGAGTVPLLGGLLPARVREWRRRGLVVVLHSETGAGRVMPALYESGRALLELGVLPSLDMTFEAVVTKLMCLLGRHDDPGRVEQDFLRPLAGELTPA